MKRFQPKSTAAGFLAHLRSASSALVPAERRVAEVLVNDLADIPGYSVSDVAQAAGCSTATEIRACKRLGFSGFQQLRSEATWHAEALAPWTGHGHPMSRQDSPGSEARPMGDVPESTAGVDTDELLTRVFTAGRDELATTLMMLDRVEFARAAGMLANAGTIVLIGTGGSAIPAQDAALRFTMAGCAAHAPSDVLAQQFTARLLGSQDVCVAVSLSGANRHTLASVDAARTAGAKIIAITGNGLCPLAKIADVTLVTGAVSEETEILSSRVAHMLVLNALNLAVQQRSGQPGFGPSAALSGLLSEVLATANPTDRQ